MANKPLTDAEILEYLNYLDDNETIETQDSSSDESDIEIPKTPPPKRTNSEKLDDRPPLQEILTIENVLLDDPNDNLEGMYP